MPNTITSLRKENDALKLQINSLQLDFVKLRNTKYEINRNPRDIPNILNKHFSTIGMNLASKLPNPSKHFSQCLDTTNYSGSFFFDLISPHEVECEISSMSTSCAKAYGLYSCPIRILITY